MPKKEKKKIKRKYDKPISLWPLKPEQALELFMKIDPKKLIEPENNKEVQQ
jgi:hypothetical protein